MPADDCPLPAPAPPPERPLTLTRERALGLVLFTFSAVLAGLTLLLAWPFLPALAWALALAVVVWPGYRWLLGRVGEKRVGLAAGLTVVLVAVGLLAPVALVAHSAVGQGVKLTSAVQRQVNQGHWRETVEKSPRLQRVAAFLEEQQGDLADQLQGAAAGASRLAGRALGGLAGATVSLLLALFTLFFLLRDRDDFLRYLRGLLPFSDAETDRLFGRINDTIYATLYGTLAVRLLQGALGGLMFWFLGLPAPLLWGAAMALVSLIPVLGAFVVWVPAAIFLALSGSVGKAIILTVWGVGVIATADNLLYPVLVGDRLKMHPLPVFISLVGGLAAFGFAGLVLGPVILALADALVDLWRQRTAAGRPAESGLRSAPAAD